MFTSSLVLSSVLFLMTALAAWRAKMPNRAYVACWLGLIPAFCTIPVGFVSFLYLYHALALALFGSVCAGFSAARPVFVIGSLVVMTGVYLYWGLPRWLSVRNALELYPPESLVERLEYERARYLSNGRELPAPMTVEGVYRAQMESGRGNHDADRRAMALQVLHANATAMFEESPGFGISRMRRGGLQDIYDAEPIRLARPISLPQLPVSGFGIPVTAEDSLLGTIGTSISPSLKNVVADSIDDFANPLAFGYIRDRGYVSGFLAHRFTKYPEMPAAGPDEMWRVESLDLVSLLKHDGPVAYISKNLPRMDELRGAPTRPLDEFEVQQLTALQRGEPFVAVRAPRRLRMLGALRAHEGCLTCHTANKGDLLGAFSYDFRLDRSEIARK